MYFIFFGIIALFAIGDIFFYQRAYKKILFIILTFWLIILAATRYQVGIDWSAYENMFHNQNELTSQNIEIGYSFIYRVMEGMNFNTVLLVISALSFVFLTLFINKFAYFKIVALLVYFTDLYFYLNLSGMRQGIALSLTLFSVIFIYQKRSWLFFLTIFVACLFHKTAIFFCLAYFFQYFKLSYKNIIIAIAISFLVSLFFITLTEIIAELGYFRNVGMYTDSTYNDTYSLGNYIAGGIKRLMPLLLLLFVCKIKEFENNLFVKLYFVGLLCFFTLYPSFPDIAVRLSLYYLAFDMIMYNLIFIHSKNISMKIFIMFILILMTGYKIYGYTNMEGYIYHNIIW
ncbi:EpsG family protein [Xenorhabdus ehlersii]|uniref:EpsG-like putative glucosyltransferase n=1 Tax=Xenorhabdus ehlersii TaxID=290111 RepID=A0A2D0IK16_9GAMM|nr:exopolysaccharide polymerization protein [Xenorhabdus ehlersii]RKE93327.1 EpsG-like putative glucosyltransferase [Xenorhabdus ehlersii]